MKNYSTHIFVFFVIAAAIAGYFYHDKFGASEKPIAVTEASEANDAQTDVQTDTDVEADEEASAGEEEEAVSAETDAALVEPPTEPEATPQNESTVEKSQAADVSPPAGGDPSAITDEATRLDIIEREQAGAATPSFDVVRVEPTGETLIAGRALPNSKIFIEKNGEVIGETTADETGTFVVLPANPITGLNNQVLIRAISPEGAVNISDQVVAIGVQDEGEPLVALVEAGKAIEILQKPKTQDVAQDVASKQEQGADPATATDTDTPHDDSASTPPPEPDVIIESVEVNGDKVFVTGTGGVGQSVRVYVNDETIGDVEVDENGRFVFENIREIPAGDYKIRVDQIITATGKVSARAEVPFVVEKEVPFVVEKKEALIEPASAETTTIVIQRNDNLWTIAKRLYGDGVHFSAIYENNRDQIRDPNLIFPGQTFTLPTKGLKKQP